MVRWYHAIFSAYGYWLPNDPRGSWSQFVGAYALWQYGDATKTKEKRSLAHDPHNTTARRDAKHSLTYPPVRFDARHREAIGRGIAQASAESDIDVLACAIGHDHVHAIVGRHAKTIEQVVGQFKGRATQQMTSANCHPLLRFAASGKSIPSPWSDGCWSVFIEDENQLRTAIDYVERHPVKEGLPAQRSEFVQPA